MLFTETTGHEDMINFMSSYQCQDKKGKHYHPEGYLCWYGCNQYGEMNGYVEIIKHVPEFVWIYDFSNKGYQKLKKEREKIPAMNEIFANEPRASPLEPSDIKIELQQKKDIKRRNKNASKEGRNN